MTLFLKDGTGFQQHLLTSSFLVHKLLIQCSSTEYMLDMIEQFMYTDVDSRVCYLSLQ